MIYLKVIFNVMLSMALVLCLPKVLSMFYYLDNNIMIPLVVGSFILSIVVGLVVGIITYMED